jgi:thiol-disulfide isomerase/thioredoxin
MELLLALARLVLAGVFVVSGVGKLLDLKGSENAMRGFGLPERLAKPAGIALPFAELLVALPAAAGRDGDLRRLGSGGAPGGVRRRDQLQPGAGQAAGLPLLRSISFRADRQADADPQWHPGGGCALYRGQRAGRGARRESRGLDEGSGVLESVLLVLVIVEALVLAGVVWLLVHLLGQSGRLLIRMDRIEEALADANIELRGLDDDEEEEADEDEGLPIGAPAPAFGLTGLYGETTTLDSLRARGNPVMLVFTDPGCGPCNALMPDIGKWQREVGGKLTVALVSRGAADANKGKASEHGISNVLLQEDNEVADAYRTFGTPTGVLVSSDGLIASGAAPGGEAIRRLVNQAVEGKVPAPKRLDPGALAIKPKPSRAQAPPPPANLGQPVPEIALTGLDGNEVRLADFKGHPTAVLFWNPGCGFCQRMVGDIKAWEANPPPTPRSC